MKGFCKSYSICNHSYKKSYKNAVLVWGLLLTIVLCTACNRDLPAVQDLTEARQDSAEAPIEIVISHSQNVDTPEAAAAKAMQDTLTELLGDRAKVTLYADYQLGSAREQMEAMQLGRVHITIQPASVVSQFVSDVKVLTMPYVFSADTAQVQEVLNGPLGDELLGRIASGSDAPVYQGLGLWLGGYKLFTFHGDDHKQIQSPADFCGLTIAVPEAPVLRAQYQRWGAEPMAAEPIALYSMLAQRIADGTEATAVQIVSNHLHEVQCNMVQAYHSAEVYTVLVNHTWFAALPETIQQAIIAAEEVGKETLYQTLAEQEAVCIERIRQVEGMRYTVLEEEELTVWKSSVQPLYTEQLSGSAWQMNYVERLRKCFT